jgi:uncharacterized tellurite resistance protein B-like protein
MQRRDFISQQTSSLDNFLRQEVGDSLVPKMWKVYKSDRKFDKPLQFFKHG